jgi:hypothetical protein
MSLSRLYDFIQVACSMRKLYTKKYYFPKHILFTMIYLWQEQKLNPKIYYKNEIIMIIFVQATEHVMHMYAKFEYSNVHRFL